MAQGSMKIRGGGFRKRLPTFRYEVQPLTAQSETSVLSFWNINLIFSYCLDKLQYSYAMCHGSHILNLLKELSIFLYEFELYTVLRYTMCHEYDAKGRC